VGLLPNVFSDPKLRARQTQLDAQWNSLWALWQGCDATVDSSFSEFSTDRAGWIDFYGSESDWSADAKTATDEWQTKAQSWATRLSGWGCYGTVGPDSASPNASGVPSIKDPPPDDPTIFDRGLNLFAKARDEVLAPVATVGWVAVGIVGAVILAIIVLATKGRAKGYGIEVGGK
jgi:hypothetical protein